MRSCSLSFSPLPGAHLGNLEARPCTCSTYLSPSNFSLRCSLHPHDIHQLPIVRHHIVFHVFRRQPGIQIFEKLAGTFDLLLFQGAELHRGHAALSFGNEVDVPDGAFLEGDCPVGVVVTYRGRDQETPWELGVDNDFLAGIQLVDEFSLYL